jgi:hypothetical protein
VIRPTVKGVSQPDDDRSPDEHHDPELTVSCERCDREWNLSAELDAVGNQAFEQFALDHRQHTGHFPDGVATWRAVCRNCPEETERLAKAGVTRWARTHARHTRHAVEVRHATEDTIDVVED